MHTWTTSLRVACSFSLPYPSPGSARTGPMSSSARGVFSAAGFITAFSGNSTRRLPSTFSGLPNTVVVVIKGVIFAIAIAAFVCSVGGSTRKAQ